VILKKAMYFLLPMLLLFGGARECAAGGKLVPFEQAGVWGYKNASGRVLIKPHFTMAKAFSPEGIAAVVDEAGWAYINEKGETIIRPFVIDNGPDYFKDGLARCISDNKFGFFDRMGKIVIGAQFDFALPFHEGLAAVCTGCKEEPEGEYHFVKGGTWGYINKQGKMVIPARFEKAGNFETGKAAVTVKGKKVFVDKKGNIIR
jgi:hypothetical protein